MCRMLRGRHTEDEDEKKSDSINISDTDGE